MGTASVTPGYTLNISVGAGGAVAANGVDSTLQLSGSSTIVALGGGGGQQYGVGNSGGSGAGTSRVADRGGYGLQPASASGGYGNDGGASSSGYFVTGGGGAGAAGSGYPGAGGAGKEWPTGSGTYYAGGGASWYAMGGTGGGGNGALQVGNNAGQNGVANTGGGGSVGQNYGAEGRGGSGVVIIRYADTYDAASATTGTVTYTTTGGYRIYKFTGAGTLTLGVTPPDLSLSTSTTSGALVVSGGAGFAGNVYIGGQLVTTGGVFWANGTAFSSGGTGGGGGGGAYYFSDTTPTGAVAGDRWFDTTVGILFTYTYDGTSYQWVEAAASGFLGQTGYTGSVGYVGSQGNIGYVGSASTVAGYTGSTGAGYTGSTGSLAYTGMVDMFVGDGATVAFTLSNTPYNINNTTVNLNGIIQLKNSYTVLNNVLTFSEAPPATAQIEITTQVYGPTATPYLTWNYTSTGGNTFTVSNGVTNDSILVMANGVVQRPVTDYSVAGSTLTLVGTVGSGVAIQIREMPGAFAGYTGSFGYTGSQGPPNGYTGSAGYIGSTGYTGSASTVIGYTGSQGVRGDLGYSGSKGYTYADTNSVIITNNLLVNTNTALAANIGAFSVGPVTVAAGVSVTLGSGSRWVIL